MKFKFEPDRVVFEGSNFVVYDIVDQLPVHKNYPHGTLVMKPSGGRAIPRHWRYGKRWQEIVKAFVHQTLGSYSQGFEGVFNTASFIVRDPTYFDDGKWQGNGRGWPAMCYSYFYSYEPELTPEGKMILWKCRPDGSKSWHTSGHNDEAIALGFQGYFRSRHMGRFRGRKGDKTNGQPSQAQQDMLAASWTEYFKPIFDLTDKDLFGHFEAKRPKAACPGDWLEHFVLTTRQAGVPVPSEPFEVPFELEERDMAQLDTWERRQGALLLLGYDLGDYGPQDNGVDGDPGLKTRAAVEGVEASLGLPVNGVWDDRLEFLLQLVHLALETDQVDIDELA